MNGYKRYKEKPIIWMLGGDRPVENETHLAIWRALATGLKKGDEGRHLITYHPFGTKSSSQYVHDEIWLDFNTLQSGHGRKNGPGYDMIRKDYERQPTKPCMDSEPNYENHPVRSKEAKGQWFDQYDVRKLCYWDLFAGAHGHTYGCHDIWMMWDKVKNKNLADARTGWREAIKLPGSIQVGYARKLIESRPFLTRIPDQSLIKSAPGTGGNHVQATRDQASTYAMIYIPCGKPTTVDLGKLHGPLRIAWFNPRTGKAQEAGALKNEGTKEFASPPAEEGAVGNDWVLLLDEAAKKYPLP